MITVSTNNLETHDLNLATVDLYSDLTFLVRTEITDEDIQRIAEAIDLSDYAKSEDVPTNVSELTNDVPYVTEDELSEYVLEINTSTEYFSLEAIEDGTFTFTISAGVPTTTLSSVSYSTDGENWTTLNNEDNNEVSITTPTITAGNKVKWKGEGLALGVASAGSTFSSSGRFNAEGNAMSLIYGDNFIGQVELTTAYSFYKLFYGATMLEDASKLILPATTLSEYCYAALFRGCTSLVATPKFPAMTLSSYCYNEMLLGCTSLVNAPELPATTLAPYCYFDLFRECSSIITAPDLPALTLAEGCYRRLFRECTSLVNVKVLPATVLAKDCYRDTFKMCSSIIYPPDILATNLAELCCYGMFQYCTSMIVAPKLPATELVKGCYKGMFFGCSAIKSSPELPATTLANECYLVMFQECTGMEIAPDLPATELAPYCYQGMFWNCTNLKYIKCASLSGLGSGYASNWVLNVPSGGVFVKNDDATWDVSGASGVPEGWSAYTESEYEVVRHYELTDTISSNQLKLGNTTLNETQLLALLNLIS